MSTDHSLSDFAGGERTDRSANGHIKPTIAKNTPVRGYHPERQRRVTLGWTGWMSSHDCLGYVKDDIHPKDHKIRALDGWALSERSLEIITDRGAEIVLIPIAREDHLWEFPVDAFDTPVPDRVRGTQKAQVDPQRYAAEDAATFHPAGKDGLYEPVWGHE